MGESPTTQHRPLTPNMKKAALLEASGMDPKEVAEAVGVTASAFKSWRQRTDYIALRDEETQRLLKRLEPLLAKLRLTAVDAHDSALAVAMEGLKAMTVGDSPAPNWPVRLQSATLIINSPIVKGMVDARVDNSKQAGAAAGGVQAVAVRIMIDENGKRRLAYDDADTVDGEGEEILDHVQLGPGAEQGDDRAEETAVAVVPPPPPPPSLDTGDPDF